MIVDPKSSEFRAYLGMLSQEQTRLLEAARFVRKIGVIVLFLILFIAIFHVKPISIYFLLIPFIFLILIDSCYCYSAIKVQRLRENVRLKAVRMELEVANLYDQELGNIIYIAFYNRLCLYGLSLLEPLLFYTALVSIIIISMEVYHG